MIVEVAGLPGCGKTTIIRRLASPGSGLAWVVVRPAFASILRRPGHAMEALLRWGAFRPGGAWPTWCSLCTRRITQDLLAVPRDHRLLIEEGIVHHTWRSLFLRPSLGHRPWPLLLATGIPLLVLDATPATRSARIRGTPRGGKVNRRLTSGDPGDAAWRRAEELFELVLSEATRVRQVVRVSTEGGVEAATERVRDAVGSSRPV